MHTDVVALDGILGSTETKTDLLVPAAGLANLLGLSLALGVEEDVRLLLESALRLDGQLGGHGCGIFLSTEEAGVEEIGGLDVVENQKGSLMAKGLECDYSLCGR